MCDWSAENVNRRSAKVGDKLVSSIISPHGTRGLEDPNVPGQAVCLLPGSTVIVSKVPEDVQRNHGVGEVATATFRQLTMAEQNRHQGRRTSYRDAFHFIGSRDPESYILAQDICGSDIEVTVEHVPGQGETDDIESTAVQATRELETV